MVTQGGRSGIEQKGMGRDQHALCVSLTPPLPLLYGYTGWLGRDGTEQEGMGPTQAAAATRSILAATATRMLLFFVIVFYFHLFFISLFFFSNYSFSNKYNNRWDTKGNHRTDGTGYTCGDSNVGWHGGGRRGQRMHLLLLMFLFFLLSSFILIILLLFQLSLFQWSVITGGQDGTDQRERRWQHQMGWGDN